MTKTKEYNSTKEHDKKKRINKRILNNISSRIKKKFTRKRKKNLKYIKYPSISHFNIDSHFVYDFESIDKILSKINKCNNIKVTDVELSFLNDKIEEIDLCKESNYLTSFISIEKATFDKITNYIKLKEIKDPITSFLKSKLENNEDRPLLSCRKLASLYYQEKGEKTNRTTINKILRDKLGYHYLKTVPKKNILNSNTNKLYSFVFIKIIIRCIHLGFKLIYIDESNIKNKNNNFRCLRMQNEQIYFNFKKISKFNLIMAIDDSSIIYYELTKETTNKDTFLKFIQKVILKLNEKKVEKYVLILDNLSCHKTQELFNFYNEKKINVLFNSPYLSNWNCIELAFRALKKKYYCQLFSEDEQLKNYVVNILTSEEYEKTLLFNYCETLKEYRSFIINNKNTNINLLIE